MVDNDFFFANRAVIHNQSSVTVRAEIAKNGVIPDEIVREAVRAPLQIIVPAPDVVSTIEQQSTTLEPEVHSSKVICAVLDEDPPDAALNPVAAVTATRAYPP